MQARGRRHRDNLGDYSDGLLGEDIPRIGSIPSTHPLLRAEESICIEVAELADAHYIGTWVMVFWIDLPQGVRHPPS